jgi:hypothetical protein
MAAVKKAIRGSLYVPSLPTLWPHMLAPHRGNADHLPFSHPRAHWFYFARNALWTAVRVLGLEGSEVLLPAYHHGVEVEAMVDAGLVPRFYRVGPRWEVDVEDVAKRITARTRVLYLEHYAGFAGPARALKELADAHGLMLWEDCALSLLAADGDVPVGSTGDLGIFCLYKTLPVPNGGALVVNGERDYALPDLPLPPRASTASHLASSLLQNAELRGGRFGRALRAAGRLLGRGAVGASGVQRVSTGTRHFSRQDVDLGISPLTLRIASGLDLTDVVEKRRRNYFLLLGQLREISPPLVAQLPPGACPLFYPLLVDDKGPVLAWLRAMGIDAIDFWRDFHPACPATEFPDVARLRRSIVELPCHQDLTPELMQRMAAVVRDAMRTASPRRAHG